METGTTASSPPPAPVSWQTALWTLIPLLLNTWGQPTGRIVTLCPKHSIFPRSYPFYTLFDLLYITLFLLYGIFYLGISPRLAIDLLIYYRYKDCDEDNGLKAFRKWRWLRWTMFALGGAQPAIKLAAFRGLPVTKAVGLAWTISWVVLEILGFLARDVNFWPKGEGPPTFRQHTARIAARKLWIADGSLSSWLLDMLEGSVSLMSGFLCFFVIQDVLFDGRHHFSWQMILLETGGGMIGLGGSRCMKMFGSQFRISNFSRREFAGPFLILLSGGLVLGVGFKAFFSATLRQEDIVLYQGHMFLLISYPALDAAFGLPLIRRYFAFDKANCSEKCVNRMLRDILWLAINIMFVILWYAYRYRSEGTYNPGWTAVFG